MNTPHATRKSTGLWICVILLTMALFVSVLLNGGLLLGIFSHLSPIHDEPVDERPVFTEIWSSGEGDVKAVRIPLNGLIFREEEGGLFSEPVDKIELMTRQILAARMDEDVRAIILEVNSPGGGVTASDELYAALVRFRESREDRRILVFIRDLAASGGYYAAAAGDWLIAEPTSVVGSIGVIMQALNFKGLSDKVGITDTTIASGSNKDLLNPFKEVNPEQVALLQQMIDSMYRRFFDIVLGSRGMTADQLRPLADGRIFSADEALANGLVDQVGYWEDALIKLNDLLGETSVKVVRYDTEEHFWDLFAGARLPGLQPHTLLQASHPRFLYLWRP